MRKLLGPLKPIFEAQAERRTLRKTLAWPHPVVANGGFYLRDMSVLLCYDVRAK